MNKSITIAIDLAKTSFHVCKLVNNEEVFSRAFSRAQLEKWLVKQPEAVVAMEACGSAHHWARYCIRHGHQVKLIAPKNVIPFRTGQKTDKNDASAIAVTSSQSHIHLVAVKTIDAQALQSIERIRQHLVDSMTATSNMLRALLAEFGFTINKGERAFKRYIPEILELADNGLPDILREHIHSMYELYDELQTRKIEVERQLNNHVNSHDECKKLLALEGVGAINALGLYLSIGEQGANFNNGREASACIGLTPTQYSTGGKTQLMGISKKSGNRRLRSTLIQGALSVVKQVQNREPKNTKEAWLKALIERAGLRKAAVALANKTVRTAWAMLHHNKEYQLPHGIA